MEKYIICDKTLAVIGLDYHSSEIVEKDRTFVVERCWQDVLNDSCLYYSSSLQGRIEGSRAILNKEYKVPILLQEGDKLIYFPVGNQTNYNCVWISLKHLDHYTVMAGKIKVIFLENQHIIVTSGEESFENQLLKAYNLEKILISRYKNLEKW